MNSTVIFLGSLFLVSLLGGMLIRSKTLKMKLAPIVIRKKNSKR